MVGPGERRRTGSRALAGVLGLLALGVAVSLSGACSLNESCDPATDPDCVPTGPPVVLDGGPSPDAAVYQTYHYVLVRDQESTGTAGTELDAVELISGGQTFYADSYYDFIEGAGKQHISTTQDPNVALGPPGSDADGGVSTVFLGGTGGSIAVSFGGKRELAEGDQVRVYTADGGPGRFGIYVGVEPKENSQYWVTCTPSATVIPECPVPPLPPVAAN